MSRRRGEHGRAGGKDRTELVERDGEDPPLRVPGEQDQRPVAFVNPILQEGVCSLVGKVCEVEETVLLLFTVLVYPDHRILVPVLLCPAVDQIEPEVKVFRDFAGDCPLYLFVTGTLPVFAI
jgi:hypothetical protein